MNKWKRNLLMGAGTVLMLGLFLIPLAVAGILYTMPRLYFSKSTVELKSADKAACLQAAQATMAQFGPNSKVVNDTDTDLYELGIWDRNPADAATKANQAALALEQKSTIPVKIWEMAQPALVPARPRVHRDMLIGEELGGASFVLGLVLVIVTRAVSPRERAKAAA